MWMMGYNDGGDSFSGRKLRTIVPRPAAVINPTCLGRINGTDLLSFNHHLAAMTEQNKRDFSPQQVVVSSRWNPTPEQLQTLEELYRRGTRTPSAEEIQHITAQLRRYGKIEGKNVFYWFQNHKARERQKRRRQLESTSTCDEPAAHNNAVENTERKEDESGVNGTGLEVEGTKNWPSSTNCSTVAEKNGASIQRTAKAAIPECRAADGWVHFDEAELIQQRNKSLEEPNATWQHMMQFSAASCSSPLSSSSSPNNLINSSTAINSALTIPALTPSRTILDQKQLLIKSITTTTHHDEGLPNIFMNPYRNGFHEHLVNPNSNTASIHETSCCGGHSDQTLQLFPLRDTDDGNEDVAEKESEGSVEAMNTNTITPPYKFFEFLPLKNN